MKAHDLAKSLLNGPNIDVYVEGIGDGLDDRPVEKNIIRKKEHTNVDVVIIVST
jgi:hypothetical protein